MLLAHGELERISLPVPLWLTILLAGVAVLAAFALPADSAVETRPVRLPRPAQFCLRILGLLAFDILMIEAWTGPSAVGANPATTWFYVWFWVGLVPLSLLFGDVYRYLNPLRTVALLLWRLRKGSTIPDRIAHWPAVLGLVIYLVLDGVSQEGDWPRTVAAFVSLYAVVHVAAGAWFGPRWFERCDTFAVYFGLIARLAPVGRRPRPPLDRSLVAFVVIAMGATMLGGFVHFPFWGDVDLVINPPLGGAAQSIALSSVVLLAASGALGVIYIASTYAIRRFMQSGRSPLTVFSPLLIPVMVAYAFSAYLPAALFESQAGYLLITGGATDYGFVSTTTIALIQFIAIVAGSVLAARTARTIAGKAIQPRLRKVSQIPLAALIVSYAIVGISVVSG